MRIYQATPLHLVRLQITRLNDDTHYLTLCDTTIDEVEQMVKTAVSAVPIDLFLKGLVTSINIRESTGGKNGKSRSVSFRGKSPKETLKIITEHLKKNHEPAKAHRKKVPVR